MATTMDGLFGASPYEVEQQQYQKVQDAARQFAQMSPFEKAGMLMYQGGSGLGRMGAEALGGVNVPVQQAQQNQQAMQGADLQTPEGLRELAKKLLAMGNQRGAYLAAQKAQEIESSKAAAELATRKQDEAEQFRRDQLAETMALKKMQLEQAAEAARLRSEDTRYTADQRAESKRSELALKMQLAQMSAELRRMGIESKASAATPSVEPGRIDFGKMKDADKWRIIKEQGDDRKVIDKSAAETADVVGLAKGLLTHPGLPDITGWSSLTNVAALPNSKAKGALTILESLKSKAATVGRSLASESGKLGNMALGEWKIVSEDIANLDPASPEFEGQVKRIVAKAEDIESRLRKNYDDVYSVYEGLNPALSSKNIPPQAPKMDVNKPTGATKGITPAEFNARWATLPRGQSLTGPDGKTYTKK